MRRRRLLGVLLVALVVAVTAWLATGGVDQIRDLLPEEAEAAPQPGDGAVPAEGASLALVTVDDTGASARRLMVLATDEERGAATALLVPTATVADIPGHGTFTLAEAHGLGGADLTRLSLGNLLGVSLDGVAAIDPAGWEQVLGEAGPLEVTTPRALVDADGEVVAEAGTSVLEGAALARYLTSVLPGEGELEALPRVQQVLAGLLDAVAEDPDLVDRLLALEAVDGTPTVATSDPALFAELLRGLATARAEERFTAVTLPVEPLGSGAEAGYRVDAARAADVVAEQLPGALPDGEATGARDVQILNGNGVPRIGLEVTERLSGGGYRVVLSGNADRFTYDTTRIVLHDSSPEQLQVGRDVQRRLGVGELELAATPGSVVDITIVVGADFPPAG